MRPVIELLHDTVGTVDDVVNGHTLLPLSARFLPHDDFAFIKAHFLGDPQHGLPSKIGMAGPRSGWAKVRLLRCPRCVEEDIGCCENPFWRRDNLIPGLLFCGKHALPLHETCEDCMDFQRNPQRTLHAGYHCGCGLTPVKETKGMSDGLAQAEIELSGIASRLLSIDYLPNLGHEGVTSAIAQAAVNHGFVRDGLFFEEPTFDFFNEHPLLPVLERTGFFNADALELSQIMKGKKTLRHPVEAILLLRMLHDDWQDVEKVFQSKPQRPQATDSDKQAAKAKAPSPTRIYRSKHREKYWKHRFDYLAPLYREARSRYPKLSHTRLLRLLPAEARLVLTESSLHGAGYDVPMVKKNNLRNQELDRELADHIQRRGHHLVRSKYPKRITRDALLRGWRRPKAFNQKTLKPHLILARAAEAKWSESAAQWKQRSSLIGVPTA
jgi:hypothetical protein